MSGAPIADDDLVDLAHALAGLRHELAGAGVVVPSEVDVDPGQRFGPWQAVLEAVRAGVVTLGEAAAGTLLERSLPAALALEEALLLAQAAAATAGRSSAADEALAVAVEDAGVLADRLVDDGTGFVLTVESFYAGALAAAYVTWVVRDLLDPAVAASGTGLLDGVLRPRAALRRLAGNRSAAAVLDVAEVLAPGAWRALADGARRRQEDEARASVHLRAAAAVAGLGGAEVGVLGVLAPAGTAPADVLDAALAIGDGAVAAAGAARLDAATCRLAAAVWTDGSRAP